MSREYGYVRVSTREQNEDRQLIAMAEAGVREENIIVEKQSGKDFERLGRSLASSWEMCYQEAKNYFELHGDLKIPKDYITESGIPLGKLADHPETCQRMVWSKTQNRKHAKGGYQAVR